MDLEPKITQYPDEVVRQLLWFGRLVVEQTHEAAARAQTNHHQQVGLCSVVVLLTALLAESGPHAWLGWIPLIPGIGALMQAARAQSSTATPNPTEPEWFHVTLADPARLRQAHLEALLRCHQTPPATLPEHRWLIAAAVSAVVVRLISTFA